MDVLIVDDSSAMRMIVKRTLRMAGFTGLEIGEAVDGGDALNQIRENIPHVVLSDWNMPNMTGIELLHALNEESLQPIFGFVTTESTTQIRTLAKEAGAKFLIAKPFSPDTFEEVLSPYFD